MAPFSRNQIVRGPLALPMLLAGSAAAGPKATITGLSLRIMPLGDSITEGYRSSKGDGYRGPLLKKLTQAGSQVEYIGTIHTGSMKNNDHEGYGGQDISQILGQDGVNRTLELKPNIVLVHAGTNDINDVEEVNPYETAPDRLGTLLDRVLYGCPSATVIVAQIISCPFQGTEDRLPLFNAKIPDLVAHRAEKGYKILSVDMSSIGLNGTDLDDGLHPTNRGYQKMANYWYEGIYGAFEHGWITPLDPLG